MKTKLGLYICISIEKGVFVVDTLVGSSENCYEWRRLPDFKNPLSFLNTCYLVTLYCFSHGNPIYKCDVSILCVYNHDIVCILAYHGKIPSLHQIFCPSTLANTFLQQNFYSISHLLDQMTTQWLDIVVTIDNCKQHRDWATNGSVVTVLPAVDNYTRCPVTMKSLCLVGGWWNRSFAVLMLIFSLVHTQDSHIRFSTWSTEPWNFEFCKIIESIWKWSWNLNCKHQSQYVKSLDRVTPFSLGEHHNVAIVHLPSTR